MGGYKSWIILFTISFFIIFFMLLNIRMAYIKHSKQGSRDKRENMKLAVKDFLNSDISKHSSRYYAAILSLILIYSFLFIGALLSKALPRYGALFLCIISGMIFLIYFIRMIIDTAKSIKKEKLKTTLKIKWDGVLSIFIFLLWLFVYVLQMDNKGF